MMRGRVIGEVSATRKHAGLEGRKLVMVAELEDSSEAKIRTPTGRVVIAIDTLDAGIGQEVLVSWGSGARAVLKPPPNSEVLADAAVSMILAETFEQER